MVSTAETFGKTQCLARRQKAHDASVVPYEVQNSNGAQRHWAYKSLAARRAENCGETNENTTRGDFDGKSRLPQSLLLV